MWKKKCRGMGMPLNNNTLYTLCFAGNQSVLVQDCNDQEYMTCKLIEKYSKWGQKINIKKPSTCA